MANKADAAAAHSPLKPPDPTQAAGLSGPMTVDAVKAALNLDTLQLHLRLDLKIIECSAETGKNVEAAFQWITDKVAW